ncbi:MAG: response regulator [Desulfobulbaceae bacterium]|nr:response regulator [Desulfobulbaceae bacterium]HIJ90572.1 response regulator [Deltaproteobacteria bacterium]
MVLNAWGLNHGQGKYDRQPKSTILCVAEASDVLAALQDTLKDTYKVKTARNGQEALDIFLAEDISLAIVDQWLPEMAGAELLNKINSIKPLCKKILLIGDTEVNAAIEAINSGTVNKYISKPWDKAELRRLVEILLKNISTDDFLARISGGYIRPQIKDGGATNFEVTYPEFLETFSAGVVLVDEAERIEFVNHKGLELLRCDDFARINGRSYLDFFALTAARRELFHLKYKNLDWTPEILEVILFDKTKTSVPVNITFFDDSEKITGFFFDVQA